MKYCQSGRDSRNQGVGRRQKAEGKSRQARVCPQKSLSVREANEFNSRWQRYRIETTIGSDLERVGFLIADSLTFQGHHGH